MISPDNNTFIIERLLEITEKEVFYFQQSKIRVINSNIDIKWIELRGLRNSIFHECMTSPEKLLSALKKVIHLSDMLIKTQNLLVSNFKNKPN